MTRFVEEEAKRQANMEAITKKAMPLLAEASNSGNMEDDWVTNLPLINPGLCLMKRMQMHLGIVCLLRTQCSLVHFLNVQ